jgi:hypothetical protein
MCRFHENQRDGRLDSVTRPLTSATNGYIVTTGRYLGGKSYEAG